MAGATVRTKKSSSSKLLIVLFQLLAASTLLLFWISNLKFGIISTGSHPIDYRPRVADSHGALSFGASTENRSHDKTETKSVNDGSEKNEPEFHIVFSTGCNAFQDWQSYVFFHQIWKSGQTGHVTRVASGCDDATAVELTNVFREQIQTLPGGSKRFHLHLTPDYSKTAKPGVDYKFFNKPYGLRHWMEEGLGLPGTMEQWKDTIFIIMDPDQFILRPFQIDYTNDTSAMWHRPPPSKGEEATKFVIRRGRPFSQVYSFGASWIRDVNTDVARVVKAALNATGSTADPTDKSSSHLYQWTEKEVIGNYIAGPPYMALGTDMYNIVKTWAAVVVAVHDLTNDHLSEMFAYSTAAAHLELPHQLAYSFMVSSPSMGGREGWKTIDNAQPEQVCRNVQSDTSEPENVAWTSQLPQVLHYCQRYFLGPHFFSKYKLPKSFLTCEHPLLVDPIDEDKESTIATKYESSVMPNRKLNQIPPIERKRHAFFLCHIISKLNDAATYFKQHHCPTDSTTNFEKTFVFPMDKPAGK